KIRNSRMLRSRGVLSISEQGALIMRFMMLVIPKGYETAKPGTTPEAERVAAMMEYNKSLEKAGVLLGLEGLHPPSMGARVSFAGGKPTVTDGPFTEAKEVIGGYWMIQVNSKEEAIEWAKRCPIADNEIIEIRRVQEFADFPPDVQQGAAEFPEMQSRARKRKTHGSEADRQELRKRFGTFLIGMNREESARARMMTSRSWFSGVGAHFGSCHSEKRSDQESALCWQ